MNARGFENDAEFLDEAARWLKARARRVAAEQELRRTEDAWESGEKERLRRGEPVQQLRCRVVTLREAEEQLRREQAERLDAHRKSDAPKLGLDRICEDSRLNDDERIVLLATAIASVSNPLAEDVFSAFSAFSGMGAADAAQLVGCVEPSDWLRVRRLFLPSGPLVRDVHLVPDRVPQTVDDLLGVTFTVGRETFAILTGYPREPEFDDDEVE